MPRAQPYGVPLVGLSVSVPAGGDTRSSQIGPAANPADATEEFLTFMSGAGV